MSPLSLLLLYLVQLLVVVASPSSFCSGTGVSGLRFSFYSFLPFLFSFRFFSLFVFMGVPA